IRFQMMAELRSIMGGTERSGKLAIMEYLLGLRRETPAKSVQGLRDFDWSGGKLTGRPGFLRSAAEGRTKKGNYHMRHETPWHGMAEVMNRMISEFGPAGARSLVNEVKQSIRPDVLESAAQVLNGRTGPALTAAQRDIMIFAICWNSAHSNLWPGG